MLILQKYIKKEVLCGNSVTGSKWKLFCENILFTLKSEIEITFKNHKIFFPHNPKQTRGDAFQQLRCPVSKTRSDT